jgi:tripartite-type tricarboxylate transporter receptor subunit TctC
MINRSIKEQIPATVSTPRRRLLTGSLALMVFGVEALNALLGRGAQAQEIWPARPIRVLSAGGAGSSSDLFVRALELRLRERLGQNVFIENKPGAGGMVAAGIASSASPDGYTFFVSNVATNSIGVSLYKKPSFDARKDLPAVARICTLSNALVVRADKGINSVADLLAYLKANPKQANFGSAGSGTTSHLGGVLLAQRAGLEITHVPYKGTAANLTALLSGEVAFTLDNLTQAVPHAKAGTLRILAVSSAKRVASHPDIPSLQEAGIKDFDLTSWFGLSAATGTPAAIVQRMGQEIVSALADPVIAAKIRELGAEPAPLSPSDYAAFIDAETKKWAPLIRASGATID